MVTRTSLNVTLYVHCLCLLSTGCVSESGDFATLFFFLVRQHWGGCRYRHFDANFNPLNPELNPICYLLELLAHHFLHVSRIRVKLLTFRLPISYTYRAPILDVSRSHTTTRQSRSPAEIVGSNPTGGMDICLL